MLRVLTTPYFLVVANQLSRELMKEILQTKEENLKLPVLSTSLCFDSCIAHVEHASQDHTTTEVGEAEEVYQEEEQQQFEGEDQEQNQELTNFVDTQGKHRCIINPVSFTIESYNYCYAYALKFIGID